MSEKLLRKAHLLTRKVSKHIGPERVLILLLLSAIGILGASLRDTSAHTCPIPVQCPEVVECVPEKEVEIVIVTEGPTCPADTVHPNPKCHFVVYCEEE